MSYIYLITNNINNKQYVGKTNFSIQERLKEHCCDYKYDREKNRPLYNAMKKYGVENFIIEQLEECSAEEASDREIYWINKLDTYNNGYNATLGGDGNSLYNHEQIWKDYQQTKNIMKTARKFNCDRRVVRKVVNEHGIINEAPSSKMGVVQLTPDTEEYINTHESFVAASIAVKGDREGRNGIKIATTDGNKTAYGYKWRTLDDWNNNIIPPRSTANRRVSQINAQGDTVNIFQNVNQAANITGIKNIRKVLNEERKSAGGYMWKYTDD